jgi:hypothetical protein
MKFRIIYTTFALASTAFLLLNNSSGAAAVQNADRTGSPLSFATCVACHIGTNFSPTITLEVLDGDNPVTSYEPGKTYQVRVQINASDNPPAYGFQAVALGGAENKQAGNFSNPPESFAIVNVNNRQYPEQSQRISSNNFVIDWEAPGAGTGEVRFYAAGVAANGNFSNSGDGSASLASPVVLDEMLVGSRENSELFKSLSIFPNPVGNELSLRIQSPASGAYQLRLLDVQGRPLIERRLALSAGKQVQTIDVATLPAGIYALHLTDGQRSSSRMVVKL